MNSRFLTNYTETSFLSTIQMNLRRCKSFDFSVSFIKKAGLVLLAKDIKAALERGAKGRIHHFYLSELHGCGIFELFYELNAISSFRMPSG